MDRFKYIQVQDKDGNYGDNIPFEIDSSNVIMQDGKTLQRSHEILISDISEKVDKEEGKGLSSEDYTQNEKNKLANIEQQANKTVIDSTISQPGQAADAKAVRDMINDLRSKMVDTPPIVVKNPSEMINTNRIYVYMGETSENNEWQNGYWYYYGKDLENNQKWLKGGAYSQASSLNDLKSEINQAKQDLEDYTDQTLEASTTTINNYVNTFNTTAQNLTDRVVAAENKVRTIDNLPQMAQDIASLQEQAMNDFVVYGEVDPDTKVAKFMNKNDVVMFTISGVGGSGGGDIIIDPSIQDDEAATIAQRAAVDAAAARQQALLSEENAERWATGSTGGTGSATNNAKYWSNLSRSYAKIRKGSEPQMRQGEEEDNAEYYKNQAASAAQEAKTALVTQRELAKAWAVGPTETLENEEEPSATNNAKYWATQGVELYIDNWVYGQPSIGREGESSNNLRNWVYNARRWAVGNASDRDAPDATYKSARDYALDAYDIITNRNTTNLVKRVSEAPLPGTAEQSFVNIETELPNKVDQLESKFKLDINDNGSDKALYDLLVALNWWNGIKITE